VVNRRTVTAPSEGDAEPWTIVEAELAKPDGTSGLVAWTMFDENGEPVSPPAGALRDQVWRLLVRRSPLVPTRQMFQVQVFIQSVGKIGDEQREAARKMLLEAREDLRRKIAPKATS
jgi:hypothetical protein